MAGQHKKCRGSLMLMTLMFVTALAVFASVFLFSVLHSGRITAAQVDSKKAFYLAEAGLNKATYYLLNTAPDATTAGSWRTAAYPAAAGPGVSDPRNEALGDDSYTMWVENYATDNSIYLTASGVKNGLARTLYQRVKIGPMGWWKFDEASSGTTPTTAQDASGKNNDGTLVNSPTWVAGKFGLGALSFDGVDDYVVTGVLNHGVGTGDFSYFAWVYVPDTASPKPGATLWGVLGNGEYAPVLAIGDGTHIPLYHLGIYWDGWADFGSAITANEWAHIGIVRRSGVISGYVNSVATPSTVSRNGSLGNAAQVIGRSGVVYSSDPFNGRIDDVRFYPRALSASEISQVYMDGSLVGHWKFDEGAGTSAADASGNVRTGTLTNGAAWSGGRVGARSVSFDGANDYVAVNYTLPRSGSSAAFWVRSTVKGSGLFQFSRDAYTSSGYTDRVFFINASGQAKLYVYSGGVCSAAGNFIEGGADISDGKWHHVAGTWSAAGKKLYVDGALVANNATGIGAADPMPFLTIGEGNASGCYTPNHPYLNGQMDDVRVYNRELSAAEVAQLYAGETVGRGVNVIANSWGEK